MLAYFFMVEMELYPEELGERLGWIQAEGSEAERV